MFSDDYAQVSTSLAPEFRSQATENTGASIIVLALCSREASPEAMRAEKKITNPVGTVSSVIVQVYEAVGSGLSQFWTLPNSLGHCGAARTLLQSQPRAFPPVLNLRLDSSLVPAAHFLLRIQYLSVWPRLGNSFYLTRAFRFSGSWLAYHHFVGA